MSFELNPQNVKTENLTGFVQFVEQRKYAWFNLVFVTIILVTIVGNSMVVLAVLKNRVLQNTTNYFLMSLAIADFLVAFLVMPLNVISEILGYFPFGLFACNFWVNQQFLTF